MQVFAFDGELIGRLEQEAADWFVCRAPEGHKLRLRSDAIYFREPGRLVLICYRRRLDYWIADS
jgi:hypothetical protein